MTYNVFGGTLSLTQPINPSLLQFSVLSRLLLCVTSGISAVAIYQTHSSPLYCQQDITSCCCKCDVKVRAKRRGCYSVSLCVCERLASLCDESIMCSLLFCFIVNIATLSAF